MSGESPRELWRRLDAALANTKHADPQHSAETSLDPTDWQEFRALAHEVLDAALRAMETRSEQPVWTPVAAETKAALRRTLPMNPDGAARVCMEMVESILPHDTGNTHPRFFGWVHGAGTPIGVMADMVAAVMNANLGGREHGAIYVERQVIEWCRTLFGFPEGTSGLLLTGTSMATLVALAVARHGATGGQVKRHGVARFPELVGYCSTEAHGSVAKAFEMLGLGGGALRAVPVDPAYRMDLAALADAIAADRRAGRYPFCVVANAGTVNTGAIDDLPALANLCTDQGLWLHVDGAFGALAALSESVRPRLAGIERANSLAFDFHKWMHVPYDAGCVLVRDGRLHRATFATRASYLVSSNEGMAAGEPWFCDYGPELSRGFRALKVWATFRVYGTQRLGESIAANCALAEYLARRAVAHPELELVAPVSLAIVCLRYVSPGLAEAALDTLNAQIVTSLQNGGVAAPSLTTLNGKTVIRVNITNHRTRRNDIDVLIDELVATGQRLAPTTDAHHAVAG